MYKIQDNEFIKKDNYYIMKVVYKRKVVYDCLIDLEDFERVSSRHWRTSHKKNKVYLISGSRAKKNTVYLHNFVLNHTTVAEYEVDHINGNSLDNRKSNLRVVTRQENIVNTKVSSKNVLGIRGICLAKDGYRVDFSYYKHRAQFKTWKTLGEAIWCRKCAENYFDIHIIDRNSIATAHYNDLDEQTKAMICKYTLDKVKSAYTD